MLAERAVEIDVIVPLRDEVGRIPDFLAMVGGQTLRPRRIIVADGMSTDGSRELLEKAQAQWPDLMVIDNHQRIVPAALNQALSRVESDIVARMDTHADYAPGYLAAVADVLRQRPDVVGVGGLMETAGRGHWGRAIASTLRRRIGLGGARHRVGGTAGPIDHVFSGCYRTSALRAIGGWDERFVANEDFEADARLREGGGLLWLTPDARSTWYVRESPPRLARQMWRYGRFKALTLSLHPGSLRLRQLAPPCLVLGLVGTLALRRSTGIALAGAYLVVAGGAGAHAARADGASALRGAAVPPLVHLSWGAGMLSGLIGGWIAPPGRKPSGREGTP